MILYYFKFYILYYAILYLLIFLLLLLYFKFNASSCPSTSFSCPQLPSFGHGLCKGRADLRGDLCKMALKDIAF